METKKEINCGNCRNRNKLGNKDYLPIYEIKDKDLYKIFRVAKDSGVLSPATTIECQYCGTVNPPKNERKVDLQCPDCKEIRNVKTFYTPIGMIKDLITDKQGYWLEWYCWKQLEQVSADIGVEISDGETNYDADICFLNSKKLVIVECKDGGDDDFLQKLHFIKKIADKFYLVSTNKMNPNTIKTVKSHLGKKFTLIETKNIDDLPRYLQIKKSHVVTKGAKSEVTRE